MVQKPLSSLPHVMLSTPMQRSLIYYSNIVLHLKENSSFTLDHG